MILLLDLNYTLVENSDDKRRPFIKQIEAEQYRRWLVELIRPHHVIMMTARPAMHREATLASISAKTAWLTDSSVILCTAAGVATPDHDAEDAALEGIQAVAANLNEGVGFDVIARAPQGSWGRFNINIMGV